MEPNSTIKNNLYNISSFWTLLNHVYYRIAYKFYPDFFSSHFFWSIICSRTLKSFVSQNNRRLFFLLSWVVLEFSRTLNCHWFRCLICEKWKYTRHSVLVFFLWYLNLVILKLELLPLTRDFNIIRLVPKNTIKPLHFLSMKTIFFNTLSDYYYSRMIICTRYITNNMPLFDKTMYILGAFKLGRITSRFIIY